MTITNKGDLSYPIFILNKSGDKINITDCNEFVAKFYTTDKNINATSSYIDKQYINVDDNKCIINSSDLSLMENGVLHYEYTYAIEDSSYKDNYYNASIAGDTNFYIKLDNINSGQTGSTRAEWGSISGNINNQTDLNQKLNTKADKSTTYTKNEVDDKIDSIQTGNVDLSNYYKKTETYNKSEVDKKISDINVPSYDDTSIKTLINNKVDKVTGKSLIADTEIQRLSTLSNYDDTTIKSELNNKANIIDTYNKTEVDNKIENARININLTDEQLSKLNVNLLPIETELKELNLFPIKGKKILILGDSLSSAGGGTIEDNKIGSWGVVVKNNLKLSDDSKCIAVGGASLTDKNNTTLTTSTSALTSDNNVLSTQVYSLLDYKKRNSDYNPDIITLMFGTNNISTVYPSSNNISTFMGDWDSLIFDYVLNDNDYKLIDTSTTEGLAQYNRLKEFRKKGYGAYRWAIETILTNFPNSTLFIMQPLQNANGRGRNIFDYYSYVKKVAEFYSLTLINTAFETGISYFSNMRKDKGWDKNWYTYDGTHPDVNGQKLIGNYVSKFIQTHYFDKGIISATKTNEEINKKYYTITTQISNGGNGIGGTLDKYGSISVLEGDNLIINITPNNNYSISSILVDDVEVTITNSYTFTNVTTNHSMIVTFTENTVIESAPVLSSISINNNAATTNNKNISIKLNSTGNITHYRIAETLDNINSSNWIEYKTNTLNYTLSEGYGIKTIYVQVKNNIGNSEIKNASIEYKEMVVANRKAILSFIYPYSERGFDDVYKINKVYLVNSNNQYTFNDTDNKEWGTVSLKPSVLGYNTNLKGLSTGDNSGMYPDYALEHNIFVTGASGETEVYITNIDTTKKYTIRILSNISSSAEWAKYAAQTADATFTVNGTIKNPIKVVDNIDTLLVFNNVEIVDNAISIKMNGITSNKRIVLNAVEIEEE